jgi:hypothetical protein
MPRRKLSVGASNIVELCCVARKRKLHSETMMSRTMGHVHPSPTTPEMYANREG